MLRVKDFQDVCANPAGESKWLSSDRRAALLAYWGGRCGYCQDTLPTLHTHFDHVIDGIHSSCHHYCVNGTWNVVPACSSCNWAKGHTAGNWRVFVAHAALNLALETSSDIAATIASETARFTAKLYSPVQGYAKDFRNFPGADILANAYTLEKIDMGTVKVNGTLTINVSEGK